MNEFFKNRRQCIRAQQERDKQAEEKQLAINIEKLKTEGKYPDKKDFKESWQKDKWNFHREINVAFDFADIFRLIGQDVNLDEPVKLKDTRMEAISKFWHQRPKMRFRRIAFQYPSQYETYMRYVWDYQYTDTLIDHFERLISTSKNPWTLADEIKARKLSEIRFTFQEIFVIAAGLIDMCQSWKDMNYYHLFLNSENIELVEPDALFWKHFESYNLDRKNSGRIFDVRWIERKPSIWEFHSSKSRIQECVDNMLEWKNAHWLKLPDRKSEFKTNSKWTDDLTSVGFCLFQMISGEEFANNSTIGAVSSDTTQFDRNSDLAEKYHQAVINMLEPLVDKNSTEVEIWTGKLAQLILILLENYKAEFHTHPYHKLWWMYENCFSVNDNQPKGVDYHVFDQSRRDERQRVCLEKYATRRNCVTMITMIGLTEQELTYEFLSQLFYPFAKRDRNGYHYVHFESLKPSGKYSGMVSFIGDDQKERAHRAAKALSGFREGVVIFVEDNVRLYHEKYW